MKKGPSREPRTDGWAVLNLPTAGQFFWMKWANFCPTHKWRYYGCYRNGNLSESAVGFGACEKLTPIAFQELTQAV